MPRGRGRNEVLKGGRGKVGLYKDNVTLGQDYQRQLSELSNAPRENGLALYTDCLYTSQAIRPLNIKNYVHTRTLKKET